MRKKQGKYQGAQSHNWLIFHLISSPLAEALSRFGRGLLLDLGCGKKPAKSLMPETVSCHLGLDLPDFSPTKPEADIYASLVDLPIASHSVDTILCTDVLEHLKDPGQAAIQMFRILKPGGAVIVTVPLFWHLHEQPHDFTRFTRYGLALLLEEAGFTNLEIQPLSGFCATFSQLASYFLHSFKSHWYNPMTWLATPLGHLLQLAGLVANKFEHRDVFTMEYLAIGVKPKQESPS